MPFDSCTPDHPCESCGRTKRCSFAPDGGAMCYFTAFPDQDGFLNLEKQDRHGETFYLRQPRRERDAEAVDAGPRPTAKGKKPEPATLAQRHSAYTELLSHLTLSREHKQALTERGFEPQDMEGFKSLTMDRFPLAKHLKELYPFWDKVPGLYHTDKGKPMLGGAKGLIFPCRDLQGKIQALRIRKDDADDPDQRYSWLSSGSHNGPSSGAPASWWPAPGASTDTVRICEGEIKAFLAAKWTGIPTISGGSGIGSLARDQVVDWLLELGACEVLVCPDADARWKPQVAKDVRKVIALLRAVSSIQGFTVHVEFWPADEKSGPKGIDDALWLARRSA